GCTHQAKTGAQCNDGDPCNALGTCDASGKCQASPVLPGETCGLDPSGCPGGFYASDTHCNTFCGSCGFCIDAMKCTFACKQSFTACCGSDCAKACPAGWHTVGASKKLPECGCGTAAPGDAIDCS